MREQHLLAKGLVIGRGDDVSGDARKIAVVALFVFGEEQGHKSRAWFDDFQTELTREMVAERSRADFGDRKAACCNDQDRSTKLGGVSLHDELGGLLNFFHFGVQNDLDACLAALGFEHVCDVLRGAIAEKLAKSFLVVRNTVFFDEGDEVRRCVAGESGFREVFVGADEILGVAMDICEITASTAGDEDFLADAIGALEDCNAATAFTGFCGAEKPSRASTKNESVKLVRQRAIP